MVEGGAEEENGDKNQQNSPENEEDNSTGGEEPQQDSPVKEEEEENDLSGFDPLPPLPEHDVADLDSLPSEHHYGAEDNEGGEGENDDDAKSIKSQSTLRSVTSMLPKMIMPGDSLGLRAFLVIMTYLVAVAVPNVSNCVVFLSLCC